MVQINSTTADDSKEYLKFDVDNKHITFEKAKEIAKIKAREKCDYPMILSWNNSITGESYPNYECGVSDKPFWKRYAQGRGANLIVD